MQKFHIKAGTAWSFLVFRDQYRSDPKFSDRLVWANSVDTDQTAPSVGSVSTLFTILSPINWQHYCMVKPHYSDLSCIMTKPTKWSVRPAKTHISLGIHPVWSESLQCTQWVAEDPMFLYADSKDSDQTGWMPRLIWAFTGRKVHFVGFVMRRLILV